MDTGTGTDMGIDTDADSDTDKDANMDTGVETGQNVIRPGLQSKPRTDFGLVYRGEDQTNWGADHGL